MNRTPWLIIFTIIAATLLGAIAVVFEHNWVDFAALETYKAATPTIVYDVDGAVLARFEFDKRTPVTMPKIPSVLVNAFTTAEDHAFFDHAGISLRGIVRSILVNLYHRRVVQGASTITQQLSRLMFLHHERTWWRKIQEVFVAFQLERQLSKEQIMELYLNNIYFGRGIYGVQAACQRFWDKPLESLTLAEAATLAAVAKSARLYSPLNAPANAVQRRNVIVKVMFKRGLITNDEYQRAIKETLEIQDYAPGNPVRLYVQEWIRTWAESMFGKDAVYRQGLKIKTTIKIPLQEVAEEQFTKVVHNLRTKMGSSLNGGMMSIDPATGAIRVMVGGYDFKQSQFNRATQAFRQTGSSFKPILFALGMHAGIEMDTVYVDEPISMTMPNGKVWEPHNWDDTFWGSMTLARALTYSSNMIAIKLFQDIGGQYVASWAKQFGFHRHVTDYPSAALGTAEATVEENVAAFNVFANNGIYVKPYLIDSVKDCSGKKVWSHKHEERRVITTTLATRMVNLLSLRMLLAQRQSRDGWFNAESIGKTGSTNGAATTWFVGATPGLTTALYIGRDDNKPMGSQNLASKTAFPIWAGFYKKIPHEKQYFVCDQRVEPYVVNWYTGKPSDVATDPQAVMLLRG